MELHSQIRATIESYTALVEFDAVVPGQERGLLFGAAKSRLKLPSSDRLAWQIADFVPIAFGRINPPVSNLNPDDHYVRIDSAGRLRVYRRLDEEPVYLAGLEVARAIAASGTKELDVIGRLSVEYQTIHHAILAGSKPHKLDMSPPILNGPDELCDPLDQQPTFAEPPWWMDIWKPKRKPWWKMW